MQLLILAHAFDNGANAVADVLAGHLGSQLTVLRPEWLGQAQWLQRVTCDGRSRTKIRWQGGHELDSEQIGVAWNRIRLLPQANFRHSATNDRDYAAAELQAVVTSFLAELGNRVHPPMRRHLAFCPSSHFFEWGTAAIKCGLQLDTSRSASSLASTVLVTPEGVIGSAAAQWPASVLQACRALAERLGFSLFELGFTGSVEFPMLCQVNTQPALTSMLEVNAVARWLLNRVAWREHPGTVQQVEVLS